MKILVISDVHLTDHFEEKKYNYLVKIIKNSDQVIINGDFWDGYLTTFEKFVNSKWRDLFPLLKAKKTIYIFGNHDKEEYGDSRRSLFSDIQTNQYIYQWGKKKLIFEHGDKIHPTLDEFIPSRFINRVLSTLASSKFYQSYAIKNDLHHQNSRKMQSKIKNNLEDAIYICGHAHFLRDDRINNFIGLGAIRDGDASYIIITSDNIEFIQESYL